MVISRVAALALSSAMLASRAAAESIKLAAWNMNNLHFVLEEPLRPGTPDRVEADYEILRKYRDRLGADVIALQEVNGLKAAALVFPTDEYDLFFSGRDVEDLVTGKATGPDPEERSDRIYTDFAVRRGVFDAVSKRDVPSLGCFTPRTVVRSDGAPRSSWRRTGSCFGCSASTSSPDATKAASRIRPIPTV